jgi:hypothetical protein
MQLLNSYKLLLATASMFEPAVMLGQVATMMIADETNHEEETRLNLC